MVTICGFATFKSELVTWETRICRRITGKVMKNSATPPIPDRAKNEVYITVGKMNISGSSLVILAQ